MTTSTNGQTGMHRRFLPLLASCGPLDEEPTADEDTDAGVED